LVEFDVMQRIYRYYPRSSIVAALTTFGVIAAGVIPGILIGVALSLLGLINRVSHPPDAILQEVPGHGFHDPGEPQLPGAAGQATAKSVTPTVPGLIAYRFYAPLLFSNVSHFIQRIRQIITGSPEPVRWLLLDAQAITDIDVTALDALHGLTDELRRKGIEIKFAHVNPPLRGLLEKTGFSRELDRQSFFPSVHECVAAYRERKS
jgi:SulP family sulfate permease